ncbi:MAG: hypothetical protein R3F56_23270 [Planctomycetota bacterium]
MNAQPTTRTALCSLLLLAAALPAQRREIEPPAPPSRGYRGPGDLCPPHAPRGAAPAAPAPAAAPVAAPRPAVEPPRPQTVRYVPPHVARALQRYGAPLELEHQRTAKARLTYAWEAVKVMPPPAAGITVAPVRPRALPFGEAVARVADDDLRPLLILRETWPLDDQGDEMGRKLANEKTVLLAKWFRCVRVADSVRHADHPLHTLFAASPAPRLVLCGPLGENLRGLAGTEALSSIWAAMGDLLRAHIDGDCQEAVSEELRILSRYDHLDTMETDLSTRLDQLSESLRPDAPAIAGVRERLATLTRERADTVAHEARVLDLRPRARK